MTLNLIELIRASGGAGIDGQSFRSNASGAPLVDGVRVTDYRITALTGWTGPSYGPTYNAGSLPSANILFSANVTRGSRAHLIQRLESAAWEGTLSVLSGTGVPSLGTLVASPSGSPSGSAFNISVQVNVPSDASNASVSLFSDEVTPGSLSGLAYGDPWQGHHFLQISNGAIETMELRLGLTYDPDYADFNTALSTPGAGYDFIISKSGLQASHLEVRWWDATSDPSGATTAATNNDTGDATYLSDVEDQTDISCASYGVDWKERTSIRLRWRAPSAGISSWSSVLSSTFGNEDDRLPA